MLMIYLLVAFAVIYAWGWAAMYQWADTKDESFLGKLKIAGLMFVLWPYVVWKRLTAGDN